MKAILAAAALFAVVPLVPHAAADPPGGADAQDVLLLAEPYPVLLRLHVRLDGRPVAAAWQRYLDRLFADLDRDGDGTLNRAEAARAPAPDFLLPFLHGTLNLEAAAAAVPFDRLDADGDGRVSRREFAAYYRRVPLDRLRAVVVPDRGSQAALTDALFRMLDRDGDGKLGRDEFPHRFRLRLTLGKAAAPAAAKPAPARGPAWFRRMDRNGDGFVSRRERLGPAELFDRLDTDGDGLLSPEEAARLDGPRP